MAAHMVKKTECTCACNTGPLTTWVCMLKKDFTHTFVQINENFERNNFLSNSFNICFCAQKIRFIEAVLLRTQKICLG